MAFKEIKCPHCGKTVGSVNESFDSSGTKVCTSCKNRVGYEYDHKTKKVTTTKE